MQIAVTTPTGNVGRQLTAMLVRAGVRPRVLAREPGRLQPSVRDAVDVVTADQTDADAIVAATEGVDALFWVDPPSASADPLTDYAAAGRAVTAAVTTNRIGRTVFQSSIGAELRHGAGEIDGLGQTEQLLDDAGATVCHLRCGFFFSNLLALTDALRAGTVPVILPVDAPMPWVDPRDIAEVAAGRLLSDGWSGRVLQGVQGPEDLSWERAMAIVSDATGREIRAERIPDEQMRELLLSTGMSAAAADAVIGMSAGLRSGFTPEVGRDLSSTTPSTLGAWAYEHLRPVMAGD